MSTFDDQFDDFAAAALMAEFGEAATYHPAAGADVPLTALAGDQKIDQRQEGDRLVKYRTLSAMISTDPTSEWGGVAAPDLRAALTIGGAKFSVEGIDESDGSFVDLRLARPELADMGRPQYRGRRY